MNEELKDYRFDSIVQLSARIVDNKELLKEIPTLEILAKLGQSLGRGCKCNVKERRRKADEAYKNILNYLTAEQVSFFKQALHANKITFRLNNLTILEI